MALASGTPQGLQAGRPLNLSVSMQALPGRTPIPTADFRVSHDQLLHILGMGQDLDTFLHVHPTTRTPTAFISKNVVFPKAGTYLIAVDGLLAPGPVANSSKLAVAGSPPMGAAAAAAAFAAAATDNPAVVTVRSVPLQRQQPAVSLQSLVVKQSSGNLTSRGSNSSSGGNAYTVTVFGPQGAACKPGSASTYVWTFTHQLRKPNTSSSSSTVSQPVNDLRPYYGAPMHLAVVSSDLSRIAHVHGDVVPAGRPRANDSSSSRVSSDSTNSSSNAGGHTMPQTAGEASHAGHGRKLLQSSNSNISAAAAAAAVRAGSQGAGPRFGPALKTAAVFPAKGRYLLVGQVARGNELILVPVVVSCTG